MTLPSRIEGVSIVLKANIYFDGKVVSHAIEFADGRKKTVGLIYPGSFRFNTGSPERMDIISGKCRVRLAGETEWKSYDAGTFFEVGGNSSFEISVEQGLAEYLCTFS